jgi:protein-tyrosine phosphatase
MVDIHSHILHGLDDGPETLEESVAMIRVAAASGTTDIVATPHADLRFTFRPEVADEKIRELRRVSGSPVAIHRGCDFHLYFENIQRALEDPSRYTINGKRYLLVEFSDLMILDSVSDVFGRMLSAGITPVITHPERNAVLSRRLDGIRQWVEAGCRVQVTAQSFLGRFGKRARAAADELMRFGLVHFVASDAHDAIDRAPVLGEAYQCVARHYGEPCAQALFVSNPWAVLAGDTVEAAIPGVRARKWWWWR